MKFSHDEHLRTARAVAKLLDSQFGIGSFRFGLDPILAIIPGIGSALPMFLSFYILWIALQAEAPTRVLLPMIFNIFVDFVIGSIPLVGVIGDAFFKSNIKNLTILERFLTETGKSMESDDTPIPLRTLPE